jgi:hypothetical protein
MLGHRNINSTLVYMYSSESEWGVIEIGWCVGCNTSHLAKLPHFPSFLSLFSARANLFDGASARVKSVIAPAKAQKSGVLVKTLVYFGGFLPW